MEHGAYDFEEAIRLLEELWEKSERELAQLRESVRSKQEAIDILIASIRNKED